MPAILVLGSGSDIAKSIARKFAKKGYSIQLAGRKKEQMERLKKDLKSRYNIEATTHIFDATDYDSHSDFAAALPQLPDVVVYSAGYMSEQTEAETDWLKTQNMIEVNYAGAVSILNQFARLFAERERGCIIGISSVAGDRGRGSNYIYGSTKAAFTAYLSGLRNQLYKKGVQVITVKPGFVYTKMTQHLDLPQMLTARPEEVADHVFKAVQKKRNITYVKPAWKWIMIVIKNIPENIFKKTNL